IPTVNFAKGIHCPQTQVFLFIFENKVDTISIPSFYDKTFSKRFRLIGLIFIILLVPVDIGQLTEALVVGFHIYIEIPEKIVFHPKNCMLGLLKGNTYLFA